jgi:hypothetical protein
MTPAMGREHSQKPLQTEGPGKELPPKSYREHVAERVSSRLARKHHEMFEWTILDESKKKVEFNAAVQQHAKSITLPSY